MTREKATMGAIFFGLLALFCVFELRLISADKDEPEEKPNPLVGKQAPAWELPDLDGKLVKLKDYKGKVLIVDFWATWCPNCVEMMPDLISLQKKHEKDGLVILGISVDDSPETVKKWMKKERVKINYPIVMAERDVIEGYFVEGFPSTFIIDRSGKVVAKFAAEPKRVLEKTLKPLFKESPAVQTKAER